MLIASKVLTSVSNCNGFLRTSLTPFSFNCSNTSSVPVDAVRITIFAVDTLSLTALETVARHEMGHALGLAHSTAPEDLMFPTIETNFPYISDCDIDAIEALYDGGNTSEVVCES
ncbi:MAG: matrixin family metalloprotease [Nitrosopumilus sp.]|nr:matrixin family metalloprotease [Nitrosopumilus sp.]